MKEAFVIKNKKGLAIRGTFENQGKSFGSLVILCHGFKAWMNQPQIKDTAKSLVKAGYTVVRFDATNCPGKSQGPLIDFTLTGYIDDIRTVMNYAMKKIKLNSCILFGFSIAAMADYIIASTDKRVKKLILQGPVYDIMDEAKQNKFYNIIKEKGWARVYSRSLKRNVIRGIKFYIDGAKYTAGKYLKRINCPTLVIMGTKEEGWNKKNIMKLYRRIGTKHKTIKIIPGLHHAMRAKKEIIQFNKEVLNWIKLDENQA